MIWVGKWHLGHYKRIYTPLFRGFKSHVGYWTGHHDYFDHIAVEHNMWGLDMRKGLAVAYDMHGKYTTDLVTERSLKVIAEHNATDKGPLFLYVAHAAAHSGNPYNPLPVSDDSVIKMGHIPHYKRRRYAAIVSKLDESVGKIVQQLEHYNMLKNSLIVFSTDNGGPAEGFNENFASNYPLRGVKNTLWEGGVRGAALLWSPLLRKSQRVANQNMHIVDWLPTLIEAAGGKMALDNLTSTNLDGQSIWQALSNDEPSPRKSVLHNIDDIWGSAALTVGEWKLMRGTNYKGAWDGWYGPAGERSPKHYDWQHVAKSQAGKALKAIKMFPSQAEQQRLRAGATVNCNLNKTYVQQGTECKPLLAPCLFNVRDDPCEYYNLAGQYPDVLKSLQAELAHFNATAVPPTNKPDDPRGAPRHWNYTWTNFGDSDIHYNDVVRLI
ncbi:arylsulfatase I-like isoform X2 [Scaptodrosophila lebanonensis]|uniref:Arylsulfatase I-like isoform X2 n=1 Tax=Drosophila lebanonensis TaxID=7225 RepID=A0A6J2U2K9_DROLE|nr:arylsulfatase I-like isoform X2 [Scaptodrosophila lebanonensis]XP_030382624.1 arylsulfatase I-like isoform X2 [Scaptodrosophila lebanonensis]